MTGFKIELLIAEALVYVFLMLSFAMQKDFGLLFGTLSALSTVFVVIHPDMRNYRNLWPWSLVQLMAVVTLLLTLYFSLKVGGIYSQRHNFLN